MAGARAALDWIESDRGDARIAVIWMQMVPGDDRDRALEAARGFPAERTTHFWDPTRLIGRTWSAFFVARHANDLREALSDFPEMTKGLLDWSSDPELAPPAWDCAFFFDAGARWSRPLPTPDGWTKQFGFWASENESAGTFWATRSPTELLESTWPEEWEIGMRSIAARDVVGSAGGPPRIEVLGFATCPHTAAVEQRTAAALKSLAIPARVVYVDQESLPVGDPRRGWPAPTILVDGRDLFGMPAPPDLNPGCRLYPGGAPTVDEIARALAQTTAARTD